LCKTFSGNGSDSASEERRARSFPATFAGNEQRKRALILENRRRCWASGGGREEGRKEKQRERRKEQLLVTAAVRTFLRAASHSNAGGSILLSKQQQCQSTAAAGAVFRRPRQCVLSTSLYVRTFSMSSAQCSAVLSAALAVTSEAASDTVGILAACRSVSVLWVSTGPQFDAALRFPAHISAQLCPFSYAQAELKWHQ
jgi:hypothetical protein